MALKHNIEKLIAKNKLAVNRSSDDIKIRWKEFPFYEGIRLVRVSGIEAENEYPAYFVANKNGDLLVCLDGCSKPIHFLNRIISPNLTNENVAQYLRFFCSFVQSDAGSFHIIDSVRSPFFVEQQMNVAILQDIPLTIITKNEASRWSAEATVLYNSIIYRAQFTIYRNGEVHMEEDEVLVKIEHSTRLKRYPVLSQPSYFHENSEYNQDETDVYHDADINGLPVEDERCGRQLSTTSNDCRMVEVFPYDALVKEHGAATDDRGKKLAPYMDKLKADRGCLPLLKYTGDIARLDTLYSSHPHMKEVIDFIREMLIFAVTLKNGELIFPPILLNGPPGTGKSRFIQDVAAILKSPSKMIDMGVVSAAFLISGLSDRWKSGQQGHVTNTLMTEWCANPIIAFEEIDKATGREQYPALNALYTLLEPNSAKEFTDEYLNVKSNCSYINWFATCNNLNEVASPIRSRFHCFTISKPNAEQRCTIAYSMYKSLLMEMDVETYFDPSLSAEVTKNIGKLCDDLREMKRELRRAIVNATIRSKRTADAQGAELSEIKVTLFDVKGLSMDRGSPQSLPGLLH